MSVKINSAKLNAELTRMSDNATAKAAHKLRQRIRAEIVMSGRINTGEMMERIDVDKEPPHGRTIRYAVKPKTDQYVYQDQGTRGAQARPGGVLRFKPKGAGYYIFRKKTGPIMAAEFTRKAIRKMTPHDWT